MVDRHMEEGPYLGNKGGELPQPPDLRQNSDIKQRPGGPFIPFLPRRPSADGLAQEVQGRSGHVCTTIVGQSATNPKLRKEDPSQT